MKVIKCELCGSNELVKEEGFFICQYCKTKYTVEEARKLLIEGVVEVAGTVQVDRSNEVENSLKNARRAYEDKNFEEAYSLYTNVLSIDSDNPEAVLYKGLSSSCRGTLAFPRYQEALNAFTRAVTLTYEQAGDSKEYFDFALSAQSSTNLVLVAFHKMFVKLCNDTTTLAMGPAIRAESLQKTQDNARTLATMLRTIVETAFELVVDFHSADRDFFFAQFQLLSDAEAYLNSVLLNTSYEASERSALREKIKAGVDVYWEAHPEEHRAYLQEQEHMRRIEALDEERAAIQKELDELADFTFKRKEKDVLARKIGELEEAIKEIRND